MTYKTHLSTGLLFSSIAFLLIYKIELSPVLVLALIISTVIGSSAPDLDTPTGELWDKIPAGGLVSRIVHPVFIGGHRHLSHSIIGIGLFTGLFYLLIKFVPFDPIIHNYSFIILAYVIGHLSTYSPICSPRPACQFYFHLATTLAFHRIRLAKSGLKPVAGSRT